MTDRNDLEHYEATEAKEIVRLLKKMGQPQVSVHHRRFKAKVLARLEEKRGKRQRHYLGFRVSSPLGTCRWPGTRHWSGSVFSGE